MHNPREYYEYLRSPLPNGNRITWTELAVSGVSDGEFKTWRTAKVPERPPPHAHEEWCRRFPAKRKRLNRLYRMIWGGLNDSDSSFEFDHVLSGLTVQLLRDDCEAALDERALNNLDRRFALESLTTLAEIARDWGKADEHVTAMTALQSALGDPIYSARAHIRSAYIAYKRSRQLGGEAGWMTKARDRLARAEAEWRNISATVGGPAHPDVKALIKHREISALIATRSGQHPEAMRCITQAQTLRKIYSGKTGQACGWHREGVVFGEAGEQAEANVIKARGAFREAIKLRHELELWKAAAQSAIAWAYSEEIAIDKYKHAPSWLLKARQEAFASYLADDDILSALDVALRLLERGIPEFVVAGSAAMIEVLRRADRKILNESGPLSLERTARRSGFRVWVDREPGARRILTGFATVLGKSLDCGPGGTPGPLQPLGELLKEKAERVRHLSVAPGPHGDQPSD